MDVSTILNGYFSDASRMFMIGGVRSEVRKLVEVARECLELGFKAAVRGFLGDIEPLCRSMQKNMVIRWSGNSEGTA